MSKVYVIQKQMCWNEDSSSLVPRFPEVEEKASPFGKIVYLLTPNAGPFNSESIISELKEKLKGFSDEDYLLLIGNPCLIGWAYGVAASENHGFVKLLQWSGRHKKYLVINSKI